jgi:hypothetical protein
MGSKEVVFSSGQTLPPGTGLELAIAWPARLGNDVDLQLIIYGCVVDAKEGAITASIDKYQFRTRAVADKPWIRNSVGASVPRALTDRSWGAAAEAYA